MVEISPEGVDDVVEVVMLVGGHYVLYLRPRMCGECVWVMS